MATKFLFTIKTNSIVVEKLQFTSLTGFLCWVHLEVKILEIQKSASLLEVGELAIHTRWQEPSQVFLLSPWRPVWEAQHLHYIAFVPSCWYPVYIYISAFILVYVMSIPLFIESWVWMLMTCHWMLLAWWNDADATWMSPYALSSLTHCSATSRFAWTRNWDLIHSKCSWCVIF